MATGTLNNAMGFTGPAPGKTGADPDAYDYLNGTNLGPAGGSTVTTGAQGSAIPGYTYDPTSGTYNHTAAAWQTQNAGAAPATTGVSKFTPEQMQAAATWYKTGLMPLAAKDMNAAKTAYNAAKAQYGFTDDDFSHVDGVAYTPQQIAAWSDQTPATSGGAGGGTGTTPGATTGGGGILDNAMQAKQATATYDPALLGDPTKWAVTPEQTVSGQMQKYADPNNPYNQLWSTAGRSTAAERGLLNSTMAESAALDSVMRNATPIATADAGTFSKAAGYNADEQNQFAQQNVAAKNQAGQFNSGQTNTLTQAGLGADTQVKTTGMNNATNIATANISAAASQYNAKLSADTQSSIAQLNADNQAAISKAHDENSDILQNSTAAANAYRDYANALLNIQLSTTMDAAAKQTAIQNLTDVYNKAMASFKAAGGGVPDASVLLNFENDVSNVETGKSTVGG